MSGPWIAADHGQGAPAKVSFSTLPPGSITTPYQGVIQGPGEYWAGFLVSVPLSAPPGQYCSTVTVTDLESGVDACAVESIQVTPCQPESAGQECGLLCGQISDGCGGTVDCGACKLGNVCSANNCCPNGRIYSSSNGLCVPSSCPPGTEYCGLLNTCTTAGKCVPRIIPPCPKVNGRPQCK